MSPRSAASSRVGAALIDLDGTLVDTRPGVRAGIEAAFGEVMGARPDVEHADLSLALDEMIGTVDPAASVPQRELLSAVFRRQYDSGHWKAALLYPGAAQCLKALRAGGVRTFVVTNKRTTAAERLLVHFDLAKHLEAVVGQEDGGAPVAKSELIKRCLADAELDPATTMVVGDSDQDAAAAASCNLPFVAVTSGAGPLGHASAGDGRVDVRSLADVAAIVLRRLGGEDHEP
jgi:phosphoglycolate phosphatase